MIEKIPIISFWIFSIHYTMQDGEIFGRLGNWLSWNLPKKIHDPVFECQVCMTPHYGSILYWAMIFLGKWQMDYIEWIVVVIAAMGLNAIIVKFFPKDEIKKS